MQQRTGTNEPCRALSFLEGVREKNIITEAHMTFILYIVEY